MAEPKEPMDIAANKWVNTMWKIIAGICVGFGISQMTIVSQVTATSRDLSHLEKRVEDIDVRTEKRIGYLADSINTTIRQNSESLALIREQMSILRVMAGDKP